LSTFIWEEWNLKRWNKKTWCVIGAVLAAAALIAGLVVHITTVLSQQQERKAHREAVAQYRAAKMARYEQENAQWDDYEVDVAFLGDSLTDGYDLNKYYPQYVTANRGIGGDTTFDLEGRLQVSVYDLKPKVAVMLIGANNTETMMENYEDILRGLQTNLPETKIVLLSMTAMGGEHWGSKNQLAAYRNVSIKLLAEKYGFTFVDLYSPLYDVTIGEVYEGYTIDGGHFTHEGYEVVTATIMPVLQELLGK
jgi:lysophospholipase L1-like esterase